MDTDQQVRERFLEESGEYFEQMEQVLLGLPTAEIATQQLDIAMRAAHSLKGGAGMMGFTSMAQVAHQLEDFLKILRARNLPVDTELETLLLRGVDCLRAVQQQLSADLMADEAWMAIHVDPVVTQLRGRLGSLSEAEEDQLLSQEEEVDVTVLVFNGGVEESLDAFEATLELCQGESLRQALCDQANHLSDLGLMGDLQAFVSLCQSIYSQVERIDHEQLPALRDQALRAWRRSQSLVQLGRIDQLPMQLDFVSVDQPSSPTMGPESPSLTDLAQIQTAFNQIELPDPIEPMVDRANSTLSPGAIDVTLPDLDQLQSAFDQIELPVLTDVMPASEMASATNSVEDCVVEQAEPVDVLVPPTKIDPSQVRPRQSRVASKSSTLRVAADDLQQINDLFGTLILERNSINLRQQQLDGFVTLLQQRMEVLESFNSKLRHWYDRTSMENLVSRDAGVSETLVTASSLVEDKLDHGTVVPRLLGQDPAQTFDTLEMDRYSELHLMAQEQMETIVKLQEVTADIRLGLQEMGQSTQAFSGTTGRLRKRITRTQMRPFSDVVSHFPRVLRDLAVQYKKKVRFNLEGGATLFERLALDLLADPLTHILRNSFDHGIEAVAADRLAMGKPLEGVITIRAFHLGNRARIVIYDDGRGIDVAKICDRMRQQGLTEAQIGRMSEQQLLSRIFEPGFSTAKRVTELSGRGVGMDVVRTNLDKLGGHIHVATHPGQSTTFTIDIPLNLSVLRIMLFEQQEMVFAIPVNVVEELVALSPDTILESEQGPQLSWQGKRVPLTFLDRHLTVNSPIAVTALAGTPIINHPMGLIVSDSEGYYAVTINRFWGEQEVAIRPVMSPLSLPPGFVGATVLGDGRVVPLVDLPQLITRKQVPSESDPTTTNTPKAPIVSQKTVLVADDSVLSRRVLTRCLEKAGYFVEQARDGQEAVDKLLGGLQVQAVICDVEMPRLDGYGVLDEIKRHPEYQHLPISMLTSRSSDKHRKLAMNLGASAYFGKPYNEQELLRTLATLIEE